MKYDTRKENVEEPFFLNIIIFPKLENLILEDVWISMEFTNLLNDFKTDYNVFFVVLLLSYCEFQIGWKHILWNITSYILT